MTALARRAFLSTLAFSCASALPVAARAGGFEVAQQSAMAAGTGGAATGRVDHAAAAWFCPAALADGGGLRTELGVTFALVAIHAASLPQAPEAPWEADTESPVATPAYLYASYAWADWAAGLAVNTPFGSRIDWPQGWAQRFDVVSSQIQFLRLSPLVAYRLGPVHLGAGPQIDIGRLYVKRATNHIVEEGSSAMVLSGVGAGAHLSAFAALGEHVGLGLSYRSRADVALSGDADFNVPEPLAASYPDQHVSADFALPDRIAAGLALKAGPVRGLLDLSLTLWSVNDELAIDFEDPATADRRQVNDWRNSLALRGGVEWAPAAELVLRAGFYGDGIPGAPPPEERLSPSSPGSVRIAATGGVTGNISSFLSVDAFYEHMRLIERASSSEDAPLASYRGYAHVFGLALRAHAGGKP
ncbi:MAG: outer membrane protein transport protein [Deltaproteobacteria bacterium]|nr:outer membrane protein transport protein [Deltaproteobacteria bacterium]